MSAKLSIYRQRIRVLKTPPPGTEPPALSIILLDWSVRELFFALDWLNRQDVPRERYELIWVEAFDRVSPEVQGRVDQHLTCGQTGAYHKHAAWNAAVLHARGRLVTLCDSDAVFPPDFVRSILDRFGEEDGARSQVLMHHEFRTLSEYPGELRGIEDLAWFEWLPLWPNVGACMTVSRRDYLRFGGLDEHPAYRGYICGPYDLAWRMVNAGIPEIWHDPRVALWHFAHPDPHDTARSGFSLRTWLEIKRPHVRGHALEAVEAFSTGRMEPLRENPDIWSRRMAARRIGTDFETEYAGMTGPGGFGLAGRLRLWASLAAAPFFHLWPALQPLYLKVRPILRRLGLTVVKD